MTTGQTNPRVVRARAGDERAATAVPAPAAPRPLAPPTPAPHRHVPGATYDRAVLFDLDGVLVNSFAVMRQAFEIAYAEVVGDGPAPFEEYNRHLGRYFPDIMRIMDLPLEMEGPFVRESYRLAGEVEVFEGAPELLADLRQHGFGTAVVTGKSGPRARSLLTTLGMAGLFDHIIGSDEVANPKPAPDMLLLATGLLDVPADRVVMVGDALTDLASARAAGYPALAALWGETDEAELLAANPDAVVRKPSQVLDWCLAHLADDRT
ncbi:HAD-IA family hydrolase [Actinosynnema pretiosum subsp. pretiosum]|uniref:AHBA synthesis associated protein n=3 Tax=Actinosynnema TaxID=40566 RepID=C6W8U6_ACTMD|nr:HAD-IA family hydrolase [Actinosynnema mirum]ACU37195.1 AHBA synthesis associated protein [Actinosynnema mirum DSM 43827]QUF05217.1 HAD-IA family hydrolase [Actinosynnema pretiosum subsp. pretiosum]